MFPQPVYEATLCFANHTLFPQQVYEPTFCAPASPTSHSVTSASLTRLWLHCGCDAPLHPPQCYFLRAEQSINGIFTLVRAEKESRAIY